MAWQSDHLPCLLLSGFPTVTRNRDTYQSIDQQDQSAATAGSFGQAEDGKHGPRTY